MKLELRLLKSIRMRRGNIFLRSDLSSLGSKTQLSEALNKLVSQKVIVKIGMGVYAKTRVSKLTGEIIPAGSLEVLVPEILDKLGVVATPSRTALDNSSGKSTQIPGKVVANTGTRRISRKIEVAGRSLLFENNYSGTI